MSDTDHIPHDHDHDHEHGDQPSAAPPPAEDAGSQALAAALRSSFAIVKVVMIILVMMFFASGIFTVGSQEKAIILRFGSPVGVGNEALLGAGLHFAFPKPIDEIKRVPIAELQKATSTTGWYYSTLTPEDIFNKVPEPQAGPSLNPAVDGYTITGDGNIIHVRATLTYRIEDPLRFVFDFTNAPADVQNALDNALIYVSARYRVDDVLTRDKQGFQERVQARVNELAQRQRLGIVIDQCQVDSRPPRYLQADFDNVLKAVSTSETVHNQALQYEKQTENRAAAEATIRTNTAETERTNLVLAVKAEAGRFTDVLGSYRANRTLYLNTRLSQTVGQVLSNVQEKYYIPENVGGGKAELRLQLSREPLKQTVPVPSDIP